MAGWDDRVLQTIIVLLCSECYAKGRAARRGLIDIKEGVVYLPIYLSIDLRTVCFYRPAAIFIPRICLLDISLSYTSSAASRLRDEHGSDLVCFAVG
jgi:hypothetical protein